METGHKFLTGIQNLIKDRAVSKIHLSKYAEEEIREYLNIMYGSSYRREGERRGDPLTKLLGYPVQIHTEPTDKEYWVE